MKTIRRRLFIFLTLLLSTTFSACDESAQPDRSSLRDLSPPSDVGVSVPDLSMPDLAPTCHLNGVKDGDETDIDCGGALCLPGAPGRSCVVGGDCQGSCVLGVCAACRFGLPGPPLLPLNGMDVSYLAIGDLNGDGNADIAAAAAGGLTVSVLLGTGGGAFAPKVVYNTCALSTYPRGAS